MIKIFFPILAFIFLSININAQKYSFQNTALPDEERISNFISLLTPEEKVSLLSWELNIPRLGVEGTSIIEGLHGLAYSGPAGNRVKGLQGDDPKYWRSASLLKHFLANNNEEGRIFTSSDFDERLFREYDITKGKTYMYDKTEPLFPFGFGLTYTTFEYSNLQVSKKTLSDGGDLDVKFRIKNTGDYDSDEVPQIYVSFPNSKITRPVVSLKGFSRVFIPKGKYVDVTIPLTAEDLKYWNVEKHKFVLEKGIIEFFVGTSSVSHRLNGNLTIK